MNAALKRDRSMAIKRRGGGRSRSRSASKRPRNRKGQFVARRGGSSQKVRRTSSKQKSRTHKGGRASSKHKGGVQVLRTIAVSNSNAAPYWVRLYEVREGTFSSTVQNINKPLAAPMLIPANTKQQYPYPFFASGWAPGITVRLYWRAAVTSDPQEGWTVLPDEGPAGLNMYNKRVRVGVTDINIRSGGGGVRPSRKSTSSSTRKSKSTRSRK
jgi:hypothetical protein